MRENGARASLLQSTFHASPLATAGRYLTIIIFGLAAYANTFTASFNFDDLAVIFQGLAGARLGNFFSPAFLKMSRPVGDFTFALNYRLHGADVVGYHVVNLSIHLLAACLMSLLVTETLRTPWCVASAHSPEEREDMERQGRIIAFFAALIFVVHPVQTQAVTYIVQRYASLATLFYVGAVLLYARARRAQRTRHALRAGLLYLVALLAGGLAMKTKQIAYTLPFVILLYEFTFFTGSLRKRAGIVVSLVALGALVTLGFFASHGFSGDILDRLNALSKESPLMPRLDYLFTQFRVIVTYLRLLVLPVDQRLMYDYPVYHTFMTPPVVLSFLLILSLILLAFWLGRGARGIARRLAAFGIFWFFITLTVESSIIPISDVIFEHRLYLPSVGACIAFTAGVMGAAPVLSKHSRMVLAMPVLLVMLAVVFAVATFRRNVVWASEVTLWEDTVAKAPNLSLPLTNLADIHLRRNEPREALAALVKANARSPEDVKTLLNIAIALDRLGMYDGRFRYGRDMYDERGNIKPRYLKEWFGLACNNLGLAQEVLGDHGAAIANFEKALRINPNIAEAHFNLGLAL
ncbi:MAG TPA: tetratricopeptide repeat protein, partial [Geobacteraceae bacterium]